MVFRQQSDFINQEPEAYLEWGRHFGRSVKCFRSCDYICRMRNAVMTEISFAPRLHIHPTSAHPKGFPEIHLVYK